MGAGSALTSLARGLRPLLPPFRFRDFFSCARRSLSLAASSQGFSPRPIFSSRTTWFSGLHCSQKYSSGSSPLAKVKPMQSLCCHAEHLSQHIMSRSTSSSSSYSPHTQRIISLSSVVRGGVGSGGVGFADLDCVFPFVARFCWTSRSKFFVCWPFVDLPDRRGSSDILSA